MTITTRRDSKVNYLNFCMVVASAVLLVALAALAVVASIALVHATGVQNESSYSAAPPEHEVKPDLFEALEAAASYDVLSKKPT